MAKKLNKKELIAVLVDTYGYELEDIKLLTNGKLEAMIKAEEEDAQDFENQAEVIVAKASKIKDDDMIPVMNGLYGTLTHRSTATGRTWRFKEFGQQAKMPFSEILAIRNLAPTVLEDGWIIVLNKQIQEDFGLSEIYKNIITPENLNQVFTKSVDELAQFVEGLPEGMKVTFVAKARDLYSTGQIDSRKVVEYIENKFGISLDDNAPLKDIVL